jgi:two-component system LytT family sensor kinase
MNKKKLYWIFQYIGWFTYGLIQVVGANMVAGAKLLRWIDYAPLILEALFFFLATHALRDIIIRKKWLQMGMATIIPRVILLALFIGFLAFVARVATIYIAGMFQASLFSAGNVIGNVAINSFIVFLWAVFYFIYHYFENYNKSLRYEAAIHEIELNNLKSQLNPHFIFNALNSIKAMVDDEPEKSKSAITQLSNILRNSLATDKKRLTSFRQEFGTVRDYLTLETIRYEERLNIVYDIHPSSFKYPVPPLMIQTLIENAIKHGISKLKEGGTIFIKTDVVDGSLKLQIRNSGHFKNEALSEYEGLGIKNTIKRLDLIYGDKASFKIYNEKNNIVITEVVIPQNPDILHEHILSPGDYTT